MNPDDNPLPLPLPDPPRPPVRAKSIAPPPGWFEPAPKKPVRAKLVEEVGREEGEGEAARARREWGWECAWIATTVLAVAYTHDAFPFDRGFLQLVTAGLTAAFTLVTLALLRKAWEWDRGLATKKTKARPMLSVLVVIVAAVIASAILSAAPGIVKESNREYEETYWPTR
jgi:hypothetical protein